MEAAKRLLLSLPLLYSLLGFHCLHAIQRVLRPSPLTSMSQGETFLVCKYDPKTVMNQVGNHQEPEAFFGDAEHFTDLTGAPLPPTLDSAARLASLYLVANATTVFMDTLFPAVPYVFTSGTLMGALRNGRIIPYDIDVDVNVHHSFKSPDNWALLKSQPGYKYLKAKHKKGFRAVCEGGCLSVPIGRYGGVEDARVLALVTSNFDWFQTLRVVDLHTGFFVDGLGFSDPRGPFTRKVREKIEKTVFKSVERCALGGISAPFPTDYMHFEQQFEYPNSTDMDPRTDSLKFWTTSGACSFYVCGADDEHHQNGQEGFQSSDFLHVYKAEENGLFLGWDDKVEATYVPPSQVASVERQSTVVTLLTPEEYESILYTDPAALPSAFRIHPPAPIASLWYHLDRIEEAERQDRIKERREKRRQDRAAAAQQRSSSVLSRVGSCVSFLCSSRQ